MPSAPPAVPRVPTRSGADRRILEGDDLRRDCRASSTANVTLHAARSIVELFEHGSRNELTRLSVLTPSQGQHRRSRLDPWCVKCAGTARGKRGAGIWHARRQRSRSHPIGVKNSRRVSSRIPASVTMSATGVPRCILRGADSVLGPGSSPRFRVASAAAATFGSTRRRGRDYPKSLRHYCRCFVMEVSPRLDHLPGTERRTF